MVIGNLSQSELYNGLNPLFAKLFDFVMSNDFNNLPLGKIEIEGETMYLTNAEITCLHADQQLLEMHRKYIDVHILLEGHESIGWKPTEDITHIIRGYQDENDCELSDDKPRFYIELNPGEFCILYPSDAHAPNIGKGSLRKLIAKIRI